MTIDAIRARDCSTLVQACSSAGQIKKGLIFLLPGTIQIVYYTVEPLIGPGRGRDTKKDG